jgi:hypothetical protein
MACTVTTQFLWAEQRCSKSRQEYATLPTIQEALVTVADFAAHGGGHVLREFDLRWGLA